MATCYLDYTVQIGYDAWLVAFDLVPAESQGAIAPPTPRESLAVGDLKDGQQLDVRDGERDMVCRGWDGYARW